MSNRRLPFLSWSGDSSAIGSSAANLHTLVPSAEALRELLMDRLLTIQMRDYGNMEKAGSIGQDLPRNDEPFITEAGDLILYQGISFVNGCR